MRMKNLTFSKQLPYKLDEPELKSKINVTEIIDFV